MTKLHYTVYMDILFYLQLIWFSFGRHGDDLKIIFKDTAMGKTKSRPKYHITVRKTSVLNSLRNKHDTAGLVVNHSIFNTTVLEIP